MEAPGSEVQVLAVKKKKKREKKLPLVLQLLMRPKPSSQQYAGTQPFPVASIWKRSYSDNSRATAGNMHAHVTYAVAS
jgi:hypothetical protein